MADKFLVSPAGYDDIGAVLSGFGKGFRFGEISYNGLGEARKATAGEVLFLNCSGQFADSKYVQKIVPVIRRFVERGGTLYASDWALEAVEKAFGEFIRTDMVTDSRRFDALRLRPSARPLRRTRSGLRSG